MLVEDNDFVHDLFRHALKRFHREMHDAGPLELIGAADGQKALEKLETEHIDLAIVDHFLPLMSGSEFVQQLRGTEAYRHLPVLMVSGGGDDVRELAMDAGVDIYLHKPVLLKQLLRTLRMLMNASTQRVAG